MLISKQIIELVRGCDICEKEISELEHPFVIDLTKIEEAEISTLAKFCSFLTKKPARGEKMFCHLECVEKEIINIISNKQNANKNI